MAMSAMEDLFEFQLKALKMDGWFREFKFHPTRKWRFDFYNTKHKIAVEIEGGIYSNGRHNRAKGFLGDMEKYNAASEMGITVLRFASHMVKNGEALVQIERMTK